MGEISESTKKSVNKMYDLEVIIPVYNESQCINNVIFDWLKELNALGILFRLIVINDGSTDNTSDVLAQNENNPEIKIIHKANSGHGPTILQGYHLAVKEAHWVCQTDSDNELKAEHFKKMWHEKNNYDAVIGVRDGRLQPLSRKFISFISRHVVSFFYGSGVKDVNCPFRLMKAGILSPILQHIPHDTFAPNVAISGLLVLNRRRVLNISVPHNYRQTGEVSIKQWKLFVAAVKSFLQTIMIRFSK